PKRAPPSFAQFQGLLPRTTFAIVVTLAATGLGTVLMARYVLRNTPEPVAQAPTRPQRAPSPDELDERPAGAAGPPRRSSPARPTAAAAAPRSAAASDEVRLGEPCLCRRPDSPFWDEPLPKLSLITISHKVRQGRGEGESRRRKYSELDLA